MAGRDLLSKLADAGEEAIGKLAKAPGGEQAAGLVTSMRDRLDEMQRKVRGLDALEARVVALEKRVDSLQRAGRSQATSRTGARKPASRARTTGKPTAPKSTSPKTPPSSDATGGGSPG